MSDKMFEFDADRMIFHKRNRLDIVDKNMYPFSIHFRMYIIYQRLSKDVA